MVERLGNKLSRVYVCMMRGLFWSKTPASKTRQRTKLQHAWPTGPRIEAQKWVDVPSGCVLTS